MPVVMATPSTFACTSSRPAITATSGAGKRKFRSVYL